MAYDLPPPALPPYNTSRSEAARNAVCGPGLGRKMTFSTTSICGVVAVVGVGVATSEGGANSTIFVGSEVGVFFF